MIPEHTYCSSCPCKGWVYARDDEEFGTAICTCGHPEDEHGLRGGEG